MTLIKLNGDLTFCIERHGGKARLVVYKSGVENVCRKEWFKKIALFVQSGEKQLFKGRLRLHKSDSGIEIAVKSRKVGEIKREELINWLEEAARAAH